PPSSTPFPYTTLFRSGRRRPVDVEVVDPVRAAVGPLDERIGRARGRERRAVEIGRQVGLLRGAAGDTGRHEGRCASGQHRGTVRSEEHTSELQSLAYL